MRKVRLIAAITVLAIPAAVLYSCRWLSRAFDTVADLVDYNETLGKLTRKLQVWAQA